MKITCKKCGKIYDYDTYMGICPKCATYYSMTCSCNNDFDKYDRTDYKEDYGESIHEYYEDRKDEQEEQKAQRARDAYESQMKMLKNNRQQGQNRRTTNSRQYKKNQNKSFSAVKIIVILFILINFVFPIIGGLFSWTDNISDSVETIFEENIDFNDYDDFGEIDESISDRTVYYCYDGREWTLEFFYAESVDDVDYHSEEGKILVKVPYMLYYYDEETPIDMIRDTTVLRLHGSDGTEIYPLNEDWMIGENGDIYFEIYSYETYDLAVDITGEDGMVSTQCIDGIW